MAVRCVVFRIHEMELPRELVWLLGEFRLMANKAIRAGLENRITSRYKLCKAVYKQFREAHSVYSHTSHRSARWLRAS